ncbi:MAG: hypothetical protein A2X61_14685 [Ignavibacteria bacterium GWB2_35_12]|nr:MAG: hypothetical protein A2X63_06610 [Ignavibacteria bacterium GWA2_35_8]OGU38329.1 MAG: hypothetical protein A2X61_14685 [Ignavibacteria bacterium GWB2_35_12]OGV23436.1 MAG: hypothetical protein A2475_06570 [Ignavibacteria bacterium RIFOXYC2_FULL_35_21]
MKISFLILLAILLSFDISFAQFDYPYAVQGPEGIYIMCGNKIPKDFVYEVFRSDEGKDEWILLKVLSFKQNYDAFYQELVNVNSHNNIYELPDERFKPNIWDFIIKTNDVDSVPLYGGLPMYREALGTAFYDMDVKKGNSYKYKIVISKTNSPDKESLTKPIKFSTFIPNLKLKSFYQNVEENRIYLRYYASEHIGLMKVKIFRCNYMQTDFVEISPFAGFSNRHDSLIIGVIDTLVHKKNIYQYYAVPYDLYGNPGIPSDTIRIINLINKAESYIKALHTESIDSLNSIRIRWKCDVPEFLRTIDIYKSENYDKGYRRVGSVSPGDTQYVDNQVNPIVTYFYYLIINNAYGQSIPSSRITGMLGPVRKAEAPMELEAESKNGVVKLKWRKPTADTRGYYVFRSDMNQNDTLTQITDIIITDSLNVEYKDSLKNVRSISLAYAVKSVNTSYDISPLSELVYISPEIKITLENPINLRAKYNFGSILLTWTDVAEWDKNIIGYNLYRKILKADGTDSTAFIRINGKAEDNSMNYYDDSTAEEGVTYLYSVESFSVGESKSSLSAPAVIEVPVFRPVSISSLNVARINDGAMLKWNRTMQENIKEYRIYRLTQTKDAILVATIPFETESYLDKNAPIGESCFYAITCVNNKNKESKIDDWVGAEK